MCGIAGLVAGPGGRVPDELVAAMDRALAHRGPDDRGFLHYGRGAAHVGRDPAGPPASVTLIHRRLAIIDLSPGGWQPMATPDGRYHIVFNGEIYNYPELRQRLRAAGDTFRSDSDTEVLLAGLARHGLDFLRDVVGMFAFALLDAARGTLLLVRDFFGIKPLYFTTWSGGFAFASEIKPLLALPGVSRRVDPDRAATYLRFGLTDRDERTLFSAISQVRPGHAMEVSLADATPGPQTLYWRPSTATGAFDGRAAAATRVREAFVESIRLHLRADVPVGLALSGGIDSSSVVAAARQVEPAADLRTFSFVAPGQPYDESRWIDAAAGALHVSNAKVALSDAAFRTDFRSWTRVQEEPTLASGVYAQYHVMRLAKEQGVTVVLDGQGGDEVFGGYSLSVSARIAHALKSGRIATALRLIRATANLERMGYGQVLPQVLEHFAGPGLQNAARRMAGRPLHPAWLRGDWLAAHGIAIQPSVPAAELPSFKDYLAQLLVRLVMPRLLRYADRNSMAFSLELRVPFLNPRLVDLAYALPEDCLVDDQATNKSLFRQAMRGLTPDVVLDRRNKLGYATPEEGWLRGDPAWTRAWLAGDTLAAAPYLDLLAMRAELAAYCDGRLPHHNRFFRWISFACWAEEMGADLAA